MFEEVKWPYRTGYVEELHVNVNPYIVPALKIVVSIDTPLSVFSDKLTRLNKYNHMQT